MISRDEWTTTTQAGKRLGVSRTTVRRMVERGELKAEKWGQKRGWTILHRGEVEKLAEARKTI